MNRIVDASLLITGILSILKPDVMATKGYSFQDDEKTIIYIEIDIVVEKEKNELVRKMYSEIIFFEKYMKFQNWLNVFVGEK